MRCFDFHIKKRTPSLRSAWFVFGSFFFIFLMSHAVFASASPSTIRYAIVMGANDGGEKRAKLKYADDDAAKIFKSLLPTSRRVFLLTTFDARSALRYGELTHIAEAPSAQNLARVLGELEWAFKEHANRGERTELWFYFAGHGDVDDAGEGYLALGEDHLTRKRLQEHIVKGSSADVKHLIIDACASYFMAPRGGTSVKSRALTPAMLNALKEKGPGSANVGVLLSTNTAQQVHESAALEGGVFSYLLRSALLGAADVNGDGRVEYAEAAAYIDNASSTLLDASLRLQVYAHPPAQRPHVALSDLRNNVAAHFLQVPKGQPVLVKVVAADGSPYAQIYQRRERASLLALVGNSYFVVEKGGEEAFVHPAGEGSYSLSSLSFRPATQMRGMTERGFAGLHAQPLNLAYLRGYLSQRPLLPPRQGPAFAVGFAHGYESPFQFPFQATGMGLLAVSGALFTGAIAASGLNLWAFARLQDQYLRTGNVQGPLAIEVESYRAAATLGVAGAGVVALLGGASLGAWWWLEGGSE